MKTPCEMKMWHVLPGIRSELARALVKSGLEQKEVAKKLSLTPASVSYYLNKKRGKGIKFSKEAADEIKKLAKELSKKNTKDLNAHLCKICKQVKVK